MDDSLLPPLTRVAVIGAGALGLTQIRQLIDAGVDRSQIVGYEARKEVGGTWTFEADPQPCEVRFSSTGLAIASTPAERAHGAVPPTAIYDSLRTNLPKTVMNFRERDFAPENDDFPEHVDVHRYLIAYADEFSLRSCIRFSTTVRRVFHSPAGEPRWSIESESNGARFVEQFSHVVVANGHHSEPFIPYVPGLHHFKKQIVHSRWWRSPSVFKGQKVVVVGSRASGGDISHDLSLQNLALPDGSPERTTIYQSTRGPVDDIFPKPLEPWTKEVTVLPQLDHVDPSGALHFLDGTVLANGAVDALIYATGYNYSVPFALPTDAPWNANPLVRPREGGAKPGDVPAAKADPLLRPRGGGQIDHVDAGMQCFYVLDPSIAFVGLAYMVVPFRLSEVQARVVARSWVRQSLPKNLPPIVSSGEHPTAHQVGFPGEANAADAWLEAIGEGHPADGLWALTTDEWRTRRAGAKDERKRRYGY